MTDPKYKEILEEAQTRLAECRATDDFETGIPEAERMLKDIEAFPHHFVLGALMDRQYAAGKAWRVPYAIGKKSGFAFDDFERLDLQTISKMFVEERLHRFAKAKMPEVFYEGIRRIKDCHQGDARRIWSNNPPAARIIRQFLEFFGCGPKIATMATNILHRQFKVPMTGLSSIDISADVQVMKYLRQRRLLRDGARKEEAIYLAREINPDFPGILDLLAWEGGREA